MRWLLVCLFVLTAWAGEHPQRVISAAPSITDFDGDGVWDLAVGEFGGGGCRLYRNLGTAKEPKFGAFKMLQSDGMPAAMESS